MKSSGETIWKSSLRTAVLLLTLLLLGSCGNKGPVQPLQEDRPAAPPQVEARQQGSNMLVSWKAPTTNQNGEPLTDLLGFRVYKMRYDLAADCPDCRDTSVLLHDIDLDYLRSARYYEGRYFLWDDQLEPGYGYQYRIVAYDRKGHAGAAAHVRLPFVVPPPPPTDLTATGHDRLVRLAWQPAAEERQGIEIVGYTIYRRRPGEPFPPLPLDSSPVTGTDFEDFGLENNRTYHYGVRALIRIFDHTVESEFSGTVAVQPRAGR